MTESHPIRFNLGDSRTVDRKILFIRKYLIIFFYSGKILKWFWNRLMWGVPGRVQKDPTFCTYLNEFPKNLSFSFPRDSANCLNKKRRQGAASVRCRLSCPESIPQLTSHRPRVSPSLPEIFLFSSISLSVSRFPLSLSLGRSPLSDSSSSRSVIK